MSTYFESTDNTKNFNNYTKLLTKAMDNGQIGILDWKTLPNICMYGINITELLTPYISCSRLQMSAMTLALAFPRASVFVVQSDRHTSILTEMLIFKRNDSSSFSPFSNQYCHVPLMDNYTYLEVKGKDLLEKNIKFTTKNHTEFEIDENQVYVLDALTKQIMNQTLYYSIYKPEIVLIFDNLSRSSIYKTLYTQKNTAKSEYTFEHLSQVVRSCINCYDLPINKFLTSFIAQDIDKLSKIPNSNQQLFEDFLVYEHNV